LDENSWEIRVKSRGLVVAAAAPAVAVAAAFMPAHAATASTGWRVVLTRHYGAASNTSAYETVAAPGVGDAWVFGGTSVTLGGPAGRGRPVAEHWNGVKWAPSVLPPGLVGDVSASAALSGKSVWAVNESGLANASILHWNGTSWSVAGSLPGTSTDVATGMLAFSSSNVWAFGNPGNAAGTGTWHYNGRTWTRLTGIARGISTAAAVSPADIWAIGSTSLPEDTLLHYNGNTWQPVTAAVLSGWFFSSILALPKDNVWAVAYSANAHLVHLSGGKWSSVPLPWTFRYAFPLVTDGSGGFWFIGYAANFTRTWAVHRTSAGAWSRMELVGGPNVTGLALVPGTTSLWGASWTAPGTGANAQIFAYGRER
jgi:hypothetical protein